MTGSPVPDAAAAILLFFTLRPAAPEYRVVTLAGGGG